MIHRRTALAGLATAFAGQARAQAYPVRPISMVLPFPAGSATDSAARYVGQQVGRELGQVFVAENQAGADGILAAGNVKRAAPDGYTLLVSTNSAHGVNPSISRKLPYDPVRDFAPVAGMMTNPMLLVVAKASPGIDFDSFMRLARERSGSRPLTYGSGNTSGRVTGELLKARTGIDLLNVPYRGTPQVLQDLVGDQIDLGFVDPFSAMGLIRSGDVRALAAADKSRNPALPDVPTMAEAGAPGVEVLTWSAFFAPARTPPGVIDLLNGHITGVLQREQTMRYISGFGAKTSPMSAAELGLFVQSELKRWSELVALAGIPKQ